MRMLWTLLAKDMKRIRRNPMPLVINLSIPLMITALIGLVFGGGNENGSGLGTIRVAIVDEDESVFSSILGGGISQGEAAEFLEPVLMSREESEQQLLDNSISAAVIIPKGFTQDYLSGDGPLKIELIKNPAQSFHPAIIEELLGVLVEGLNALSLNFQSEIAGWSEVFQKDEPVDFLKISRLFVEQDGRVKAVKEYLDPPLVGYTELTEEQNQPEEESEQPAGAIFAFLLPGLASMFLLFLSDNCIRDLYRETTAGTMDRFRTLRPRLELFILSKVAYAIVVAILSGGILFGGGALIFGIEWQNPLAVTCYTLGFGIFATGFMSLLAALARSEKKADVLNTVIILGISIGGGALFPAQQLPPVFRDFISPILPNNWFIEGIRAVQFENAADWPVVAGQLAIVGLFAIGIASFIYRNLLLKGGGR